MLFMLSEVSCVRKPHLGVKWATFGGAQIVGLFQMVDCHFAMHASWDDVIDLACKDRIGSWEVRIDVVWSVA